VTSNVTRLDTRDLGSYKPARSAVPVAVFGLAVSLSAFAGWAAGNVVVKGAVLPPGSTQVGESRYRSPLSYAETVTFFGKQYGKNPRKSIVNLPGLRGFHIVNTEKGEWDGLNVYELEGETRIFVVGREPDTSALESKESRPGDGRKDDRPARSPQRSPGQ
jgi:hypothetical protein